MFRIVCEFSVNFIHSAGIREGRGILFQNFQKGTHLTFANNANEQSFILVRIHTFRMKRSDSSSQSVHEFGGQFLCFFGNNFKFIAAFQPLQHKIYDEIGDKNIGQGRDDRVCSRLIHEESQNHDGSVHGEGQPSNILFRTKAFN